ncbi:hypothetical protein LXL04_011203 [Taraxacum kok-saghyz]
MEANTPSSVPVPSSSNLSKPPLTSKKKSRKTSDVWDHFTRNLDNPNDPRAICNYCDKSYVGGNRSSGTSTLRGHMVNQCPNNPFRIEDKKQKTLIFQKMMGGKNKSVEGANLKAVGFSQSDCRIACVKMIILDELSFRFVEQEGFKLFCSIACPKFDIPSRIIVSRDIKKLYCDEKKKLKDYFIKHSQRVSLTTDTWTSIQNVCYMVLTAHFIDHEWKMQKRILNFCQISNHKGDTIGKAIETCLRGWGIEKVFAITVDNASSNNVAIAHIKKRLQIWKTTVCDGDFLHMRCSAHILNLVVGDGLKELNDSIVAVRNAVRYVRASPERLGRFQRSVNNTCKLEKASVCLDVATRWNSTYFMLDRAIKYSDAFKLLEEDDEFYMQYFIEKDRNGRSITGPPTSNDWENCAIFCRFLKLFYEATLKFSASLFVTANSYFHEICTIRGRIMKLCDSDPLIMKDMASKMKIKFDKYWGCTEKQNVLLYVAVVLDPRYKMRFVILCLKKLYDSRQADTIIASVNNSMSKLFSHYSNEFKLKNPQVSSTQCGSSIPTPDKSSMLVDSDDEDSFNMFANDLEKECEEDDAFNKKNELEKYLEERSDGERKNKDFDILVWWKMSTSKYPVLAMMARDVLAIQVSTVASESSFSTGGRVLDSFRSSLDPTMVEALICCQNWIRSSSLTLDMGSLMEDIEAYEGDDLAIHLLIFIISLETTFDIFAKS